MELNMALSSVKKLSALLRGMTSRNIGFYCLDCLYSFRTKNKLESLKKVHGNIDFYDLIMLSHDNKISEFNQ